MDWRPIEKSLAEAAAKAGEHAQEEARKAGVPFFFEDDHGRWMKEYPDGRRVEVVSDEHGEREIPLV